MSLSHLPQSVDYKYHRFHSYTGRKNCMKAWIQKSGDYVGHLDVFILQCTIGKLF